MNVWYTSDLHIGHKNIIDLCGRPFSCTDEMDEIIIQRWNSVVRPEDTVYLLGDICMGDLATSLQRVKRLMGNKILVPGNHDRVFSKYKGSEAKKAQWDAAYREIFTVADEHVLRHRTGVMRGPQSEIDLCHFPFAGDSRDDGDRYAAERPPDRGQALWHGHVHEAWKTNGRQINVGVDVHNFYPVAEEELIEMSIAAMQ